MTPAPAADAAASLVAELVAHGIRDVVISPGSRSQALALAATHLARQGVIRLHIRIDERVAGFTALGIARETRVPTAVICTSGTAAANLLPAAMEAFHSGVPLLLLTADRPPELRGVGANQATTQPGLFSAFVRWEHDAPVPGDGAWSGLGAQAVAAAMGADAAPTGLAGVAGPAHLNLPMREPLSSALPEEYAAVTGPAPDPETADEVALERGPLTVVIAGADAGADAALLRRDDVDVVAVRSGGEELNLNGRTRAAAFVSVDRGAADREWLGAWMQASAASVVDLSEDAPDHEGLQSADFAIRRDAVRAELDAVRRPLDRELLVDAVWRATWPHDRLMFGSSRLVRVADAVLGGKKVPVHSSRGLAGIDGTVATATGIAIASQGGGAAGITRVLLGDLAFLHDAGALLLPPDEPEPRMQVIVGNDGGGTIFDGLEVAASAPQEDLDRAFFTPHTVQIEQLALAYGWEYQRVTTRTALDQALTSPVTSRQIIEVPLQR